MIRRNTPAKQAILDLLTRTGKAMSPESVGKNLKMEVDRATVYRVLNRFCEDGILHRIVADDGVHYFAICVKCEDRKTQAPHFHFRCTSCDTMECLPVPVVFSVPESYKVGRVNAVLTGVCAGCSRSS